MNFDLMYALFAVFIALCALVVAVMVSDSARNHSKQIHH